jgi:hypothetical protein
VVGEGHLVVVFLPSSELQAVIARVIVEALLHATGAAVNLVVLDSPAGGGTEALRTRLAVTGKGLGSPEVFRGDVRAAATGLDGIALGELLLVTTDGLEGGEGVGEGDVGGETLR